MDLFSADQRFETLPIEDADISILRSINTPLSYEHILQKLRLDTPWRQEAVRIYGKMYDQPRLVAWYGDPGKQYTYSGISLTPLPWTHLLLTLRRCVEEVTDARFNSVFLNLYRDHRDSMGFHSDDERELGPEPCIASMSFGASREFVLKHKRRTDLQVVKIPLGEGTVLLMKGQTQRNWKHGILKQTKPCGPRVNLTFRTIYS